MGEGFVRDVVVAVEDRVFPQVSGPCPICEGQLDEELINFPIERDYDEAPAIVVVKQLPALVCTDCRNEWVRDDVLERYDHKVEKEFQEGLRLAS